MSSARTELRQRIERLSAVQRALLAERTNNGADPARSATEQLIAWVVPADNEAGDATDSATLSVFLRERLPEHMVPSLFVVVDAIPRLPNGKVDAAALPDPVRASHGDGFVSPRNAREEVLARVWAAVLGL
ncbi:MAG: AMP-binding enzyme, partial [Longimicrobiales bacterium]